MEQQHPEFSEEELLNSITNNREGESCRYAFLLGAGASVSSNIPAAGKMAKAWLDELKKQNISKYEAIKADEKFDEKNLAALYPDIYKMKFGSVPQDGYQAIENYMSDNEVKPSIGYTILAQVLNRTSHNVVLTTNFDRLTETALLDFENIHARVIAHESMLNVVPVHDKKPSIIKVHRDMIFSPISTAEEIEELDKKWRPVIQTLFSRYHVIALGYGGNDGGLMSIITDVLKDNPQSRLFWCYLNQHPETLSSLLRGNGIKDRIEPVSITGFDEFLYKLRHRLGFKLFTDTFENTAKVRKEAYQKQLEAVQANEKSSKNTERKKAVEELFADTWWQVQDAVDEVDSIDEQNRIYQAGIEKFPKSHQLIGNYANFLTDIRKDHNKAESHYQKALTAEPDAANINGNYASFLTDIRKDHDKAEAHYQKAIKTEPIDAVYNGNYANFLTDIRKNHDKAEAHYQTALTAEPDDANINGNYAVFLKQIRKDYDKTETHYQKSLTAEPDHAGHNSHYANFLTDIRKDYDKADTHHQKALIEEPNDGDYNGNYAKHLLVQGMKVQAEPYLIKSEQSCDDNKALTLELAFYRLALFQESQEKSRKTITELLDKGVSSPGWDLSGIIAQAEHENCEYVDELKALAAKISAIN